MKKKFSIFVCLIVLVLLASWAWAESVSLVSKETVKDWMETGDVAIVDVRQGRDWSASEFKIKGAFRADPGNLSAWQSRFKKDKKIVLYCA